MNDLSSMRIDQLDDLKEGVDAAGRKKSLLKLKPEHEYVWPFYVKDRVRQELCIAKLLREALTLMSEQGFDEKVIRRAYVMHWLARMKLNKVIVDPASKVFKAKFLDNSSKAAKLFDKLLDVEKPAELARQ